MLYINFSPHSHLIFLKYCVKFGQAKQFSKPLIEIHFKSSAASFQRLIHVWEELIWGHTTHTILVIPHFTLRLNRTLNYLDNIFLDSHTITFAVLCFGVMLSAFIRDAIKKKQTNRLMKSTIHFVLVTWKTLATTSFSFCSRKPLMKIFWQSWLLGKALYPLSNSLIFSQLIRV